MAETLTAVAVAGRPVACLVESPPCERLAPAPTVRTPNGDEILAPDAYALRRFASDFTHTALSQIEAMAIEAERNGLAWWAEYYATAAATYRRLAEEAGR